MSLGTKETYPPSRTIGAYTDTIRPLRRYEKHDKESGSLVPVARC